MSQVGGWGELQEKYMTAVANVTYVSPDTGAACGLPRGDAWTILREAATSDMPWPGFLLGQTPASIWYWCADQVIVQRTLSAKNISHAKAGCVLASLLKFLPLFLLVFPGMAARVLFTNEVRMKIYKIII